MWWKSQAPRAKPSAATGDRSRPTFSTHRAPFWRAVRGKEKGVVGIPSTSCQAKRCDRGPVAAHFLHGRRAAPAGSGWKGERRGGNPKHLVPGQALRPGTGRGPLSPRTARVPAGSAWKGERRSGNPKHLVPGQVLRPGTGRGPLSPRTARPPGGQRVERRKAHGKRKPRRRRSGSGSLPP